MRIRYNLFFIILSVISLVSHFAEAGTLRLDTGFKPAFVFLSPGDFAYINDIKEQRDGKIVVAGWFKTVNGISRRCIARLNGDGTLDTGFDPGTGVDNGVKRIAVQSDNKVLLAGNFTTVNEVSKQNLARLNSNGSVDVSFAASVNSTIWDMDTTGGNILIGGQFYTVDGASREQVALLHPDGSVDTSFNPGSGVTSGNGSHWVHAVATILIVDALDQHFDKFLVGGDFTQFNHAAYNRLVRLQTNGAVDSTFNIGTGFNNVVTDIVVQPDGRYLVGGSYSIFNGTTRRGIVRLLDSGALDTTFNCSVSGGYGEVRSIALQEDGRILIGGNFTTVNGVARMNIARLNADGSVDMDFNPGAGTDNTVSTVATTGQDQVLVGGHFSLVDDEDRVHVARFNDDPSMGGGAANPYTLFAGGKGSWKQINLPRPRVNTGSLDLVTEGTLYYLDTIGPPVYIRLTYNSNLHNLSSGSFGNHWNFLYESSIFFQSNNQVKLKLGTGAQETYTSLIGLDTATPGIPVTLSSTKGTFNQLVYYRDYWLYTEKNTHFTYRYEAAAAGQIPYLTKITDRNGNILTITPNLTNGKIQKISDAHNRQINFTYTNGRCTRITVPDGRKIEFLYDQSGQQLIQIKDMIGYLGEYSYDAEGYMILSKLGGHSSTGSGQQMSFSYGNKTWGSGKYITAIQAKSGQTKIEPINGSLNQIHWIDPRGHVTTILTEKGKTSGIVDPSGAIRSLSYVEGLPKTYTGGKGKMTQFSHDNRGNLSSVTDALGKTTRYFYDSSNNLIRRQDAQAHNFFYHYDNNGNLITVDYPNSSSTHFTYTSHGQLATYTNGVNNVTRYSYDSYGNLIGITSPDTGKVTYHFWANDRYSRCYRITNSRGNQKDYIYDDNNRIIHIFYGAGSPPKATIDYTYDALDLLSVTDELGRKTRVERNEFGRIVKSYDPLNNLTKFTYDGNGNLIILTNPLKQKIQTTFDSSNHPVMTIDPQHRVLKRTYDADGNLLTIKNARLKTTTFTYDANNRLTRIRNPLGQVINKTYDSLGLETKTENSSGSVVSRTFDSMRNLTEKSYDGITQKSYTYDKANHLLSATDTGVGTKSYTYDNNGRVSTITWPDSTSVSMTYDTEGNSTAITYPDGLTVSSTYDTFCRRILPAALRNGPVDDVSPHREKHNQATSMSWTGGSVTLQYNKAGKLLLEDRSNGTQTHYQYDANQKIIAIDHTRAGTDLLNLSNQYDAAGRCVSTTSSQTLLSPVPENAVSLSYDDGNQLLAYGVNTYTYDADGNVTAIGNTFAASYDAENKLVSMSIHGTATIFGSDGDGFPYRIARDGTVYIYHCDQNGRLLFITDQDGLLISRFIYRGNRLVAQQDMNSQWYFYHFDVNGNTLALTNNTGDLVKEYSYSPHGLYSVQGTTPYNPFTFVGRYGILDQGDNIYLMTSRLYLADTGRFLQRDPSGLTGGFNLYVYAGNNPIGYIDPQGTLETDPEEYAAVQTSEGTADLASKELPYYTDEGIDPEVIDAFTEGVNHSAGELADLYGSIPGAPGGNYLNAARAVKDGNYGKAAWETCKGLTGCIPGIGTAINLTADSTELAWKQALKNSKNIDTMEYERIKYKRPDAYKYIPHNGPKRRGEWQMLGETVR